MQIEDIKELLKHIQDPHIKFFIQAINLQNINQNSQTELLKDLGSILYFTKNEVDKKRIRKYISKIHDLKTEEKQEKTQELKNLETNMSY